jgi:hypothetical protein
MITEGIYGLKSFFFGSRKMKIFFIWFLVIIILLFIWIGNGPVNDRTVGVSALICGISTFLFWNSRKKIAGRWNLSWSPRKSFILIGGLGAVYVETVFWFFEKIFGASGVAASPHLGLDLLATMPWYLMMVYLLFSAQIRHSYSHTEILLLGGVYELGADGIFGQMLEGITFEGLILVSFMIPLFVMVYSFIVLPPTYILRKEIESIRVSRPEKDDHRILGGLRPLLGLIPYFALTIIITGLTG